MTYFIANGLGESESEPSPAVMRRFLDELDASDQEHGAAWVSDDVERVLEWNVDGRLVFDNDESGGPRHMVDVSKDRAIGLWQLLAQGRIGEIEKEPWVVGLRPSPSSEERQRHDREQTEHRLAGDCEFFELLGPERDGVSCREHGCPRGTISQSAFCRKHHFEMIRGYSCPFDRESA